MVFLRNNIQDQRHQPHTVASQSAKQKPTLQIAAAVFVCNAWLFFDNEQEVKSYLEDWLQQTLPEAKLCPGAPVEPIVGYPMHKPGLQANMYDLLYYILAKTNLAPEQVDIRFVNVRLEIPHSQLWCYVAVKRSA